MVDRSLYYLVKELISGCLGGLISICVCFHLCNNELTTLKQGEIGGWDGTSGDGNCDGEACKVADMYLTRLLGTN